MKIIIFSFTASLVLSCCGVHKKHKATPAIPAVIPPITQPLSAGNCGLDYSDFHTEKLETNKIVIDDHGMDKQYKIMNLNEMNNLPESYLKLIGDAHIPVKLINGGVVGFDELSYLKGKPYGATNSKYTWDDVAGLTAPQGIFIGTLNSGGNSISIHESGHAIDFLFDLTSKSTNLEELFQSYSKRRDSNDPISDYRFSNSSEFFATGFDDYYCSSKTRRRLKTWYPMLHEYFESKLDDEISKLSLQIAFDSQK